MTGPSGWNQGCRGEAHGPAGQDDGRVDGCPGPGPRPRPPPQTRRHSWPSRCQADLGAEPAATPAFPASPPSETALAPGAGLSGRCPGAHRWRVTWHGPGPLSCQRCIWPRPRPWPPLGPCAEPLRPRRPRRSRGPSVSAGILGTDVGGLGGGREFGLCVGVVGRDGDEAHLPGLGTPSLAGAEQAGVGHKGSLLVPSGFPPRRVRQGREEEAADDPSGMNGR